MTIDLLVMTIVGFDVDQSMVKANQLVMMTDLSLQTILMLQTHTRVHKPTVSSKRQSRGRRERERKKKKNKRRATNTVSSTEINLTLWTADKALPRSEPLTGPPCFVFVFTLRPGARLLLHTGTNTPTPAHVSELGTGRGIFFSTGVG